MKIKVLFSLLVVAGMLVSTPGSASAPGLPFTEDFSDTSLRDADGTTANWSTSEQALILNWRETRYGVFAPGLTGSDISSDTRNTQSIALGDIDGDNDLDLVAGNLINPIACT